MPSILVLAGCLNLFLTVSTSLAATFVSVLACVAHAFIRYTVCFLFCPFGKN